MDTLVKNNFKSKEENEVQSIQEIWDTKTKYINHRNRKSTGNPG